MNAARFSEEEFLELKKLIAIYEWGLQTLMTRLRIVNEDLKNFQHVDVIDHIAYRLKTPESIAQKLHKLGLEMTCDSAKNKLFDIAGIRIICSFARDINYLVNLFRLMPDVIILMEKDYINHPKDSGYRSYHVILQVPVFFSGQTENVTVEVQIRTEAMNFWATLEHRVKYKFKGEIPKHLSDELASIAHQISALDK